MIDRDAITDLTARLKEEQRSSNETAFMHAALYHWHNGEHDKARDYVKYVIDQQPQYAPAQVLLGWVDLTCGRTTLARKSVQFFEKALSSGGGKKDIEVGRSSPTYITLIESPSLAGSAGKSKVS